MDEKEKLANGYLEDAGEFSRKANDADVLKMALEYAASIQISIYQFVKEKGYIPVVTNFIDRDFGDGKPLYLRFNSDFFNWLSKKAFEVENGEPDLSLEGYREP